MTALVFLATIILTGLMLHHSSNTASDYTLLKSAETTDLRCAFYKRRVIKSASIFGLGGLILLACSNGLQGLWRFPEIFGSAALMARNQTWIAATSFPNLLHSVIPVTIGVSISALVPLLRPSGKPVTIGDIGAILPRNGREIAWGALLSMNAGISEELCFRLALPFALTVLTGNAIFAFVASTLLFGFLHRYQGFVGIAFTTILGGVLAIQYLATGNLALVMVIHAGFNMMAMVVRPIATIILMAVRDNILKLRYGH